MATPVLKRSAISFRRQGSSGLAWSEKWIAADKGEKGPLCPTTQGTFSATATVPESPLREDGYSVTASQGLSTEKKIPSRLRQSRSVGLIGTGHSRNRDLRVGNSDFVKALPASASVKDSNSLQAKSHHSKTRWNLVKWFKRQFSKGKKRTIA